ncbi:MAG: dockerin type I repeat-containing protein [Oscillospiraceae bacterium]|nr:dockerin type I repeat-containing protein [Oscillospiraceae bacterium]
MNSMMKKLTAALLAAACVPVMGLTAAAYDDDPFGFGWGTVSYAAVNNMELIPLHDAFINSPNYRGQQCFASSSRSDIIEVTPRRNVLRFVLRDEVNVDEAADQIGEVVDNYIPGLRDGYHYNIYWNTHGWYCDNVSLSQVAANSWSDPDRIFELIVPLDMENKAEIEAGILLGLAQKHLISEYYGWGQTASYQSQTLMSGDLIFFDMDTTEPVDWKAVEAYLAEHYPDLTMTKDPSYPTIEGTGKMPLGKKAELRFELQGEFGIETIVSELCEDAETTVGQNALLKPGDITLDTDISIVDVIALNRNIMTGDPLCDTAKLNADINGNGAPDETDSLNLLKYIVGINETLEDA